MRIVNDTKYEEIQPNRVKELRMCGITRTTLWEIETGRKDKMGDKFEKIAEVLNVTVHELCNVKE